MKSGAASFIFVLLTLPFSAQGGQITETFNDNSHKDPSSTAVWNQALNYLHSPLAVSLTNGVNNEDSLNADIGDGSDGPFTIATAPNFGTVSGSLITINTNTKPIFQFTTFILPAGYTLQGTGTYPLWFKVQGAVTVNGTIDCSGNNGAAVAPDTGVPAAGGTGRCGGGSGGAGGYSLGAATAGQSGGTGSGGGGAGSAAATGTGGGGGGGYRAAAYAGSAGGGGGGVVGISSADPQFFVFGSSGGIGAGSGGGGGGYAAGGTRGGGGGAGGGAIRITAGSDVTLGASGAILARAGVGGGGAGGGGGGGGGAGGSIWIQTPGNITNNGTIDASTNSSSPNGGVAVDSGGRGCDGRTWMTFSQPFITTNAETPASELLTAAPFQEGEIHYSVASYIAISKGYDTLNTAPSFLLAYMTTANTTTASSTFFIGGSSDNFVNDDTGWQPVANLSLLNGKRYWRFKIQITMNAAGFASTPFEVTGVAAVFNGYQETNFQFGQGCGTLGGPEEGLFLFSIFALIYFTIARRRRSMLNPA